MKCLECRGACCESFAVPVNIRPDDPVNVWFLLHATVGKDRTPDGRMVDVAAFECRCTKLTGEGRCGIYPDRPTVCRQYEAGGNACLLTVKRRRTPEEYQRIRDESDPVMIHG